MDNDILSFISLRRIFFQNVYRILIIMTFSVALFTAYYLFSVKTYEIKTLLQIDYSQKSSSSIETSIFAGNEETSLEEQMLIYASRSNFIDIVQNLNLDILVNAVPIDFAAEQLKLTDGSSYIFDYDENYKPFRVVLGDENFEIFDGDENIFVGVYGEVFSNEKLTLGIESPSNSLEEVFISFLPLDYAIESYLEGKLALSKVARERDFFSQGSLIEASYISHDRNLAKTILNEANSIFINNSVELNSQEAARSLIFLNQQIDVLKKNLETQQSEANSFKENNKSLSIEAESLALIDQYTTLTSEIKRIEVQIADALVLYKSSNPRIISLKRQLDELRNQEINIQNEISLLPKQQQDFIELSREIEVNSSILDVLQQKQVEFSLLEASTLGNVRVIDNAYVSSKVSPKGLVGLITFLIFGALISTLYSIIRSTYYMPINLPSDITDEIPETNILGVIVNTDDSYETIKKDNFEQINTLVTNITHDDYTSNTSKTFMITGPTSGAGKTTTCLLVSSCLAERDNKVLLIDCDYRRGDINKKVNKSLLPNTNFISEKVNFEDYKISENLYFIPRPSKRAESSLRVFESIQFKIFLENAKKEFDYIVLDTPPCLSITDSMVLSRYADKNFLVVRHAISKIGEIKTAIKAFDAINAPINGCIYNAFSNPTGISYYDYSSYNYYGYNYKSYDYKADDQG